MKTKAYILRLLILAGLFFVLMANSFAQPMGGSGMRRGMRGGHGPDFHEKNLENLKLIKLLELLELTDEQSDKFIGEFTKFRKKAGDLNKQREMEIETLSKLLQEETPDKIKIKQSIDSLHQILQNRMKIGLGFHQQIETILTIEQLGRMVIFQERFDREILESIRGFRDRMAPPAHDGKP